MKFGTSVRIIPIMENLIPTTSASLVAADRTENVDEKVHYYNGLCYELLYGTRFSLFTDNCKQYFPFIVVQILYQPLVVRMSHSIKGL